MYQRQNKLTVDSELLAQHVHSNRTVCYSLCKFLSQERMDWKGIMKIDKTLPPFVKSTPKVEESLIAIARVYNHKRKWLLERGAFAKSVTPTMMRNFILVNDSHWISAHVTILDRMEAMRVLVIAMSPKPEAITSNGYTPDFRWDQSDHDNGQNYGEFVQI